MDTDKKAYIVCVFTKTNSVAVIPYKWISTKTKAHWPPLMLPNRVLTAVKNCVSPDIKWPTYDIRVLYASGILDIS